MGKITNNQLSEYINKNDLLFSFLYGITNEEIDDYEVSAYWKIAEEALFKLREVLNQKNIITEEY